MPPFFCNVHFLLATSVLAFNLPPSLTLPIPSTLETSRLHTHPELYGHGLRDTRFQSQEPRTPSTVSDATTYKFKPTFGIDATSLQPEPTTSAGSDDVFSIEKEPSKPGIQREDDNNIGVFVSIAVSAAAINILVCSVRVFIQFRT